MRAVLLWRCSDARRLELKLLSLIQVSKDLLTVSKSYYEFCDRFKGIIEVRERWPHSSTHIDFVDGNH